MAPPATTTTTTISGRYHHNLLRRHFLSYSPSLSSSPSLSFSSRLAATPRLLHPHPHALLSPLPKSLTPSSSYSPVRSLFTGIVEEVGRIRHVGPPTTSSGGGGGGENFDLVVEAKNVLSGTRLGDSIAVDGTCLTVTALDTAAGSFTAGVSPETLRRTSLGERAAGDPVNLERALTPASRMGGHFVQGHVDGTGDIVSFRPEGDSLWVTVRAPPEILRLLVPKGFVAVDGTSLTVVGVYEDTGCFDFMLVRYTQENIVLPRKKVGDKVNLEVDILGKYVEKLLAGRVDAMGATKAGDS